MTKFLTELITDKTPILKLSKNSEISLEERYKVLDFESWLAHKYVRNMYYENGTWYYFKKDDNNSIYPFYIVDELMGMYDVFFEDFNNLENIKFISTLGFCRLRPENINDIEKSYNEALIFENKFINKIYKEYKNKIDSFSPKEIIRFIEEISDLKIIEEIIIKHKNEFSILLERCEKKEFKDFFRHMSSAKQFILYSLFYDNIIKNPNIQGMV